jgi:hypothetical protein
MSDPRIHGDNEDQLSASSNDCAPALPVSEERSLIQVLTETRNSPSDADTNSREENLRRLVRAAMPAVEVPDSLRQRVLELEAAQRDECSLPVSRILRGRSGRWVMAAGLTAAGIAAAIVVQPTWVAAQALKRMEAAITDARSVHRVTWRVEPDGTRRKTGESYYQGGRWRLVDRRRGHIQIFADGRLWHYEPALKKVTVWSAEGPFGYNPSGFSVAAMARDFARWGWRDRIRVLGRMKANGHLAYRVVIESADEPHRTLLIVDAATDLPLRSEGQARRDGRWVTQRVSEHRYSVPLPAELFEVKFPPSTRVIDFDADRKRWQERLSRGIARQRVGDRTIVVRDIQVCAEGDIFVLYTAGKYPNDKGWDYTKELADDRSTGYRNGGMFQPYMAGFRARSGPGYVFDGEKLEGYWWVPAKPKPFSWPRSFTLTFHVAPVNRHGNLRDEPPREEELTEQAMFHLTVEQPTPTLLPEYMPYMAYDVDEWELRRARAYRKAQRCKEQHDLPGALEAYREVLRVDQAQSRESGEPMRNAQVWIRLGELLLQMDRKREARSALQRAVREAVYKDSIRQMAQEALEAVETSLAWSPGRRAPSVTAADVKGRARSTDGYRGQVLLIDIWSPFGHELPQRKAVYERYREKGFAVLGIGIGRDRREVLGFAERQDIPWPLLVDDTGWNGTIARPFSYQHPVTRLPRTILLDRQGIVRYVDLRGEALERAVGKLVGRR